MKPILDLDRILHDPLSGKDYFREVSPKQQIYLHHSSFHPSPSLRINQWRKSGFRMGTCVVVAGMPYTGETHYKDGDIFQCFPAKYWSLHLASHAQQNTIPAKFKNVETTRSLEKGSIGIELCNAGWLTWENGRFYSSFRSVIPEEEVIEYVDKYREKRFFHKYTQPQIESIRQLLHFFCDRFRIPKRYNADMWDISSKALSGTPGIFTHTSVRSDLTDCHPQPEFVRMLMELEQEEYNPSVLSTAYAKSAQNLLSDDV